MTTRADRMITVTVHNEIATITSGAWTGGESKADRRWSGVPRDAKNARISPDEAVQRVKAGEVLGLTEDGNGLIIARLPDLLDAGSEPLDNVVEFIGAEAKQGGDRMTTDVPEKVKKVKNAVCVCGCGLPTLGGDFAPGHDSKLRSLINQIQDGKTVDGKVLDWESVPKEAYQVLGTCDECPGPVVHGHRHSADPNIAVKAAAKAEREQKAADAKAEREAKKQAVAEEAAAKKEREAKAKADADQVNQAVAAANKA